MGDNEGMTHDSPDPSATTPPGTDPTLAELQDMLAEADPAEAPALADRIAQILSESLDANSGDAAEASP